MDAKKAQDFFAAKMNFTTGPIELNEKLKKDKDSIKVVDVRAAEDYAKGHVPGAINIPKDKWDSANGLSKDKTNIIYCYSHVCHLAAKAALHFAKKDYPVMEMDGGYKAWCDHSLAVEK